MASFKFIHHNGIKKVYRARNGVDLVLLGWPGLSGSKLGDLAVLRLHSDSMPFQARFKCRPTDILHKREETEVVGGGRYFCTRVQL